jgi:hypothetical protein
MVLAVGALFLASYLNGVGSVRGLITNDQGSGSNNFTAHTFFATTTGQTIYSTTTTAFSTSIIGYNDSNGRIDSGKILIAGARNVEWYFGRAGVNGNQGTSVFTVEVSPDGTNWYSFGKLQQSTSTTFQASAIITAATTTLTFGMNLDYDNFLYARCKVTETTDGEHSCSATVQF